MPRLFQAYRGGFGGDYPHLAAADLLRNSGFYTYKNHSKNRRAVLLYDIGFFPDYEVFP